MDSQEVKVVMESCEDSADFVSFEVAASGSKFMRPSFHHFSKNVPIESQTDSRHLSHCIAAVDHVLSPSLDCFFEIREILRQLILSDVFHDVSDVVEIPPFSIMGRR